ncbi:MAG: serine/threonine protein kinase [Actinobacteria bacterium]|nr:serine/threonine protein kinase [Actinomycetota bacterium]
MKEMSWTSRYRMIGEATRGDAAEAFRAVDPRGNEVVVKVTRPRDPQHFLHQMEAAAKVDHPNVAHVFDWGKEGGHCWVAREPVDGVDLRAVMSSEGRLSSEAAAIVGEQAAAGLAALHAAGVLHGGVAPHTVLRGFDGTVKLVDVGLRAAVVPVDLGKAAPAALAWYTSPEEALGQPPVPASDQYALGAVLYELTTGRRPFDGPDAFSVADMQVGAQPPPPRALAGDIPPSLENVVLRAMQKQPEARYTSMADVERDLRAVVMGAHVPLAPPPAPEKKRPVVPWMIALLVLMAAAAVLTAWALGAFGGGIAVPDLAGKDLEQARTALEADKLKLGKVEYEEGSSADTPGVAVVAQSPKSGDKVGEGTAVDVTMSADLIEVPDVVGKSEAQAVADITGAELKVDRVEREASDTVAAGLVIKQTPQAGAEVAPGSPVTLVVSSGQETASVPDVVGASQSDAEDALESAGFKVATQEQASDAVPAGDVISQDPSAGVTAAKGATVTLVISTGPTPTPTPTPTETPPTAEPT